MTIHTIIPIKNLNDVKKRLSHLLNKKERKTLSIFMIKDVLKAVASVSEIEEVIVVSPDKEVLNITNEFGFTTILEESQLGVNSAVKNANKYSLNKGVKSTLVLPSDIPLIKPKDINKIINTQKNPKSVVITPSKRMDGTNALLRTPPDIIQTSYDQSSYESHKQNALKNQIPYIEVRLESIMLDLDIPEDIYEFMSIENDTQTYQFLSKEIKLNA